MAGNKFITAFTLLAFVGIFLFSFAINWH